MRNAIIITIFFAFACKASVSTTKKNSGNPGAAGSPVEENEGSSEEKKAKNESESVGTNNHKIGDDIDRNAGNGTDSTQGNDTGSSTQNNFIATDITAQVMQEGASKNFVLFYSDSKNRGADSCTLSLSPLIEIVSPCSCLLGSCSIGIKALSAGSVTLSFTVSVGSEVSLPGDLPLTIMPDLIDDGISDLGFRSENFSSIAWQGSYLETVSRDENARQLQFEVGTFAMTETEFDISGLVGYWPFEGTAGQNLSAGVDATKDYSGNQHHGDVSFNNNDYQYGSGVLGTALTVGSSDSSSIDLGKPAGLEITSDFTFSFWAKAVDLNQVHYILGRSVVVDGFIGPSLSSYLAGGWYRYRFEISGDCSTANAMDVETSEIGYDKWFHITAVYSSGNYIRIYLDGILQDELSAGVPASICLPVNDWAIMQNTAGDFDGGLDKVMIFARALPAEEVLELYQRQTFEFEKINQAAYTSRVFDSGNSSYQWNILEWLPSAPYGKELPEGTLAGPPYYDSTNTESVYDNGNIDDSLLNNLVAYWRMNGESGQTVPTGSPEVIDYSGYDRHLTAVDGGSAMSFAEGKINQSISFDGNNDLLEIANEAAFDFGASYSISLWVSLDSRWYTNSASSQIFLSKRLGSGDNGGWSFGLCNNPDCAPDEGLGMLHDTGGGLQQVSYPSIAVDSSQWNHYGVTWNSGSHLMVVYMNGEKVAENLSISSAPSTTTADSLYIGYMEVTNSYLDGKIDEVSIWNKELSGAEMRNLFLRAAMDLKFQVRSCMQDDCNDGVFSGPAGSTTAFYTEAINDGIQLPSINLVPARTGRYFQYKVIFDSQASSAAPQLQSVTINP